MNWFRTILMYATLYPAILICMILSTYQAGINCFWPMFWTSYIEMMFLSLGDLFFLDYLLLKKTGNRLHADTQFAIDEMDLVRSFYAGIITISRFDIMYYLCA